MKAALFFSLLGLCGGINSNSERRNDFVSWSQYTIPLTNAGDPIFNVWFDLPNLRARVDGLSFNSSVIESSVYYCPRSSSSSPSSSLQEGRCSAWYIDFEKNPPFCFPRQFAASSFFDVVTSDWKVFPFDVFQQGTEGFNQTGAHNWTYEFVYDERCPYPISSKEWLLSDDDSLPLMYFQHTTSWNTFECETDFTLYDLTQFKSGPPSLSDILSPMKQWCN